MASELEVELDEWRDGQIAYIRDYRYVTADAELTLAPKAKPARDGAANDVSSCNGGIPSDDERQPPTCACDTAQSRFHSRCRSRCLR